MNRNNQLWAISAVINESDDDMVLTEHRWHESGTVNVWLRTFKRPLRLRPGYCLLYGARNRVYIQRQDRHGRLRTVTWTTFTEVQCDR